MVGEEELSAPPGSGVREWATLRTGGDNAVDQGDRLVVERHHPLGVELAKRDFQPGAVAWDLVDAVEFQVEQLSDAQPTSPLASRSASAARRYSDRSSASERRRSASTGR